MTKKNTAKMSDWFRIWPLFSELSIINCLYFKNSYISWRINAIMLVWIQFWYVSEVWILLCFGYDCYLPDLNVWGIQTHVHSSKCIEVQMWKLQPAEREHYISVKLRWRKYPVGCCFHLLDKIDWLDRVLNSTGNISAI